MYVKNNKGLIAIIIILAILVIALGVYIFKGESIRQWVSKDVPKTTEENNTKYEKDVNKIITLGTGMKRPSQYKPSEQYYIIDNRKYELNTLVNSLKNEELKKEINTFIKESTDKLENKRSDFQQYIEEGNKEREKIEWAGNKLDYYRVISTNLNSGDESDPIQIFTEWKCTNGYLSISLSYKYAYGEQISSSYNKKQKRFNYGPYEIYCATYDLYTGKKIQLSDLFFEGEDYSTELYELMQSKMSVGGYGNYIKRDFSTLEQNYEKFTLNSIFFDKQNTVFSEGAIIPTEYYYTIFPVITIGRDMKGIFNDKIEINKFAKFGFRNQIVQTEVNGIPYKIPKIKHWNDKIGEKININIEKYMEYIMKNYKDILDTSDLARGSYQGNTVELSYNEEKNIRYIINYKSAYPFIEIIVNRYTGELESVEPSMGMDTIKPNSIPWSDALEKMKGL